MVQKRFISVSATKRTTIVNITFLSLALCKRYLKVALSRFHFQKMLIDTTYIAYNVMDKRRMMNNNELGVNIVSNRVE